MTVIDLSINKEINLNDNIKPRVFYPLIVHTNIPDWYCIILHLYPDSQSSQTKV